MQINHIDYYVNFYAIQSGDCLVQCCNKLSIYLSIYLSFLVSIVARVEGYSGQSYVGIVVIIAEL